MERPFFACVGTKSRIGVWEVFVKRKYSEFLGVSALAIY